MGLDLYELLPDYRDRCPLCRGSGCAVRHGLYRRKLVDADGRVYERFPVARFLCRRRGPERAAHRTFSVLPAEAVPRRRFSLGLMVWIVRLLTTGGKTLRRTLDELAALGRESRPELLVEEAALCRILRLFGGVYARLRSFPAPGLEARPEVEGLRPQAWEVVRLLEKAGPRGSPGVKLVLSFHRRWPPRLLWDLVRPAASR